MLFRGAMRAMAFAALLCAAPSFAFDDAQYPDLSGQWIGLRMPSCRGQPSFDKQFVRDWLETSGWDKNSTPPELPADVVEKTRAKYLEAHERLTGKKLTP